MIKQQSFQQAKFSFRVFLIAQVLAIPASVFAAFHYFTSSLDATKAEVYTNWILVRIEHAVGLLSFHEAQGVYEGSDFYKLISNSEALLESFAQLDQKIFVVTPIVAAVLVIVIFGILKQRERQNDIDSPGGGSLFNRH